MDTGSLLDLVMVRLVRILLECFLVVDDFGAEKSARRNRCSSKPNSWSTVFSVCRMSVGCVLAATLFLPAATKLWSRLCFYTCLWFCPRGGLQAERTPLPGRTLPQDQADPPPLDQADPPDQADHAPPRPGRHPPGPGRHPPGPGRHPRDQADPPNQADPPGPGRPLPPGSRLQNTVYERPVRILLECILVYVGNHQ